MNEQVHDPNRRQHYGFRRDGENLIVDIRVAPGGDVPVHFHPAQEERWTVCEGRVRFKVDGRKLVPDPGVELVVAPGVEHAFTNLGPGEARLRAEVRPALELQGFLEDSAALARAGHYTRHGVITSVEGAIRVAELIERYRDVAVVCWPPRVLQRFVLGPMLALSRKRSAVSQGRRDRFAG